MLTTFTDAQGHHRMAYMQLDTTIATIEQCRCEVDPFICPIDAHKIRARQNELKEQPDFEEQIMPVATVAVAAADQEAIYQLPIANISPSPMNPRKHFAQHDLEELAASIRDGGIRQPIVVRPRDLREWREVLENSPDDLQVEIVMGERRWRAAQLAGQETAPVIVRPYTNEEALQAMLIENLQRKNVTPLEEGAGYRALLDKSRTKRTLDTVKVGDPIPTSVNESLVTVEDIARMVGKKVGYVYGRMKLLGLIEVAQKALADGNISPGHGVLLARLQPADQERALRAILDPNGHRRHDKRSTAELIADVVENEQMFESGARTRMSEKGLRDWIKTEVSRELKAAPWDLDDTELVPTAGACSLCPKNSANNPDPAAQKLAGKNASCMDPDCYKKKQQTFLRSQTRELKQSTEGNFVKISECASYSLPRPDAPVLKANQWVPAKRDECPNTTPAIVVEGDKVGTKRLVCTDPKCKVHKHPHLSDNSAYNPMQYALEQKKQKEQQEREQALRFQILGAIAKEVPSKPAVRELLIVCRELSRHLERETQVAIAKRHGWDLGNGHAALLAYLSSHASSLRESTLTVLAIELAAAHHTQYWDEEKELHVIAKAYRVDPAKVRKEFKSEVATSAKGGK